MNCFRNLPGLGALLLAAAAPLLVSPAAQPPAGLDASEWAGLRAAYDAGRHRIAAAVDGHQARNPGQQWHAHFDGQGFLVQPDGADWQWGLRDERSPLSPLVPRGAREITGAVSRCAL